MNPSLKPPTLLLGTQGVPRTDWRRPVPAAARGVWQQALRSFYLAAGALLCALCLWQPAHAARLALVVGNDAYSQIERLTNTGNSFKARITRQDDVVFFYAGHGVQLEQPTADADGGHRYWTKQAKP